MTSSTPKIKYFLLGKLSTCKLLYDCITINDPQTIYESQEILLKFSEKKICSSDKIKIKSRDSFYFINVDIGEYFYLTYGNQRLAVEEAFDVIEKISNYIKDKYGHYYSIDEIDMNDQQNITNIISSFEKFNLQKDTVIRVNTSDYIPKNGKHNNASNNNQDLLLKESINPNFSIKSSLVIANNPSIINSRYKNVDLVNSDNKTPTEDEKKNETPTNREKENLILKQEGTELQSNTIKLEGRLDFYDKQNTLRKSNSSQFKTSRFQNSNNNNIKKTPEEIEMENIKQLNKIFLNQDDETNSTTELPLSIKITLLIIFIIIIIIPIVVISILVGKADEF